ncbi:Hypothetical protein CINCED_3A008865 [Cinara cedri]|uniref:SAM domain-containing protein n=1 Tax=Cinara cedri TaxID=506608 RepID=A0A5E4MV63_9HEMI|nr:Hypothetical protein CINCED_3A008865 [Cinara cedri]
MEESDICQSDENIETIMDVDSPEDHNILLHKDYDDINETNSQYELSDYSINDESLVIVEDDDSSSNDMNSEDVEITVENKSNRSTIVGILKKHVNDKIKNISDEIEISDQHVPIKPCGITSLAANKQINEKKKDYLNLEKIIIPKKNMSNVKLSSPVISNTIKKLPSISIASTNSVLKSTTKTAMLHPKLNTTEVNCHKSFSKPKQEILVIPPSNMNYIIRKRKSNSDSFKSNSSMIKTFDMSPESVEQNTNLIISTPKTLQNNEAKKLSKFVARMHKLPDGKYRMVPTEGKVPIGLESLFKRNSHFIKHKMAQSSFLNKDIINKGFISVGKQSVNSQQLSNTKKTSNVQQNRQVSSGNLFKNISKTIDFSNGRKDKKFIPHTVTSKDLLENHKNFIIENGEIKIKTNGKPADMCASSPSGFIQLKPKSESLIQSDNQSHSISRYGKATKNDHIAVEVLSLDSINKSKTKLHTNNKRDGNNTLTNTLNRNNVLSRDINYEEQSEFSDSDDRSAQFVSCHYTYCDTLVHEPELIDNLYCSETCKRLNSKLNVDHEEPIIDVQEITNSSKKPKIDRKKLLAKLENRINKRKQMLTSTRPEKMARNDDWDELDQIENSCNDQPKIKKKTFSSSSCQNNILEDVEDLISAIDDKKLLRYMEDVQFKSAPKKLFDKPFPNEKNCFRVGQKLEGIDPEHEALFCVMTVAEVRGYRIRLNFDGYSHGYDFWVNADCPDLFYPRWCKENGRIVQPPKNYKTNFDWTVYLKECFALDNRVFPAPKWNFSSTKNLINCNTENKFNVGAKLEALDKLTRTLPKQLICVATVADVLGNRIRIHFDGWTDDFDYWTDITSTNIHPIRWCDNNGRSLSPPSGYNDFKGKKPFTWDDYLLETNSEPVPEEAFVRRPLRDFSINMTIEVVDLVNQSLIRIAKVVDVRGDELKILYDGFHNMYAYWVEDDSPDIHPIGWSLKTNHPIEIPPGKDNIWSCKIEGCSGKGNINHHLVDHILQKDCPYELDAWKKAVAGLAKLPDRLKTDLTPNASTTISNSKSQSIELNIKPKMYENSDEEKKGKNKLNTICSSNSISQSIEHTIKPRTYEHNDEEKKGKHKLNTTVPNNQPKHKEDIIDNRLNEQLAMKNIKPLQSFEIKSEFDNYYIDTSTVIDIDQEEIRFDSPDEIERQMFKETLVFPAFDLDPLTLAKRNRAWTRHHVPLGIPVFSTGDVRKWSVKEVASYVNRIISPIKLDPNPYEQISLADHFINQNINGDSFLMLTQDDLMTFKIPLGIALKITCAISMLRRRIPVFDL